MRVSVEYFNDEPCESPPPLRRAVENHAHPQPKAASRAGSGADKLVKERKRQAGQEELATVDLKMMN